PARATRSRIPPAHDGDVSSSGTLEVRRAKFFAPPVERWAADGFSPTRAAKNRPQGSRVRSSKLGEEERTPMSNLARRSNLAILPIAALLALAAGACAPDQETRSG